jgi:hypothetical protein
MTSREVLVSPARMGRWVENFVARHGQTELGVVSGQIGLLAQQKVAPR